MVRPARGGSGGCRRCLRCGRQDRALGIDVAASGHARGAPVREPHRRSGASVLRRRPCRGNDRHARTTRSGSTRDHWPHVGHDIQRHDQVACGDRPGTGGRLLARRRDSDRGQPCTPHLQVDSRRGSSAALVGVVPTGAHEPVRPPERTYTGNCRTDPCPVVAGAIEHPRPPTDDRLCRVPNVT